MRRFLLLAPVLWGAALLIVRAPLFRPHDVSAGTAIELDLQGLVDGSALILEARVASARCFESSTGRIETEYRLDVDRTFWGTDLAERVVRLPGGVLADGRGLVLPGMPGVREGEDLILFLSAESPDGLRMPVGLAQGKLRVLTGMNGQRVLAREPASLSTLSPGSGAHNDADGWEVLRYAETLADLRAAVDRRRALDFDAPLEGRSR